MGKSPEAFRTISEVAELLDTPAHVLRFWESRFTQIRPVKRAGGRRYYRPADVALLGGIKRLLHDDGMTIRGVQKILREQGVAHVCALATLDEGALAALATGESADATGDRDLQRGVPAAADHGAFPHDGDLSDDGARADDAVLPGDVAMLSDPGPAHFAPDYQPGALPDALPGLAGATAVSDQGTADAAAGEAPVAPPADPLEFDWAAAPAPAVDAAPEAEGMIDPDMAARLSAIMAEDRGAGGDIDLPPAVDAAIDSDADGAADAPAAPAAAPRDLFDLLAGTVAPAQQAADATLPAATPPAPGGGFALEAFAMAHGRAPLQPPAAPAGNRTESAAASAAPAPAPAPEPEPAAAAPGPDDASPADVGDRGGDPDDTGITRHDRERALREEQSARLVPTLAAMLRAADAAQFADRQEPLGLLYDRMHVLRLRLAQDVGAPRR